MPQEEALTTRSLLAGLILAIVMAGVNSFLTLKVGIIEEGTVITAMLFVGTIVLTRSLRATAQETAFVATMGSAGGSFGFIANYFAAMVLVGHPLSTTQMIVLPVGMSFLGLMMAIPLSRLYILEDRLPWPTSRATITAIRAVTMEESKRQAVLLFALAAGFGAYVLLSGGFHLLPEEIPITAFGLSAAARVGFVASPFILCAGYLVGLRVGIGFLCGGIVLTILSFYVPNHQPHKYPWPGVAFLVTSGLIGLLLNWRTLLNAFTSMTRTKGTETVVIDGFDEARDQVMAPRTFKIVLGASFAVMTLVLYSLFSVSIGIAIMMLAIGVVALNFIATRSAGETAFNPVRVMGVLLQGLAALCGGTGVPVNLTAAGVAAGTIDQASLLTQDRVFGREFGLTAKRQWFAQLAALLPVAFICAKAFERINRAYPLRLEGEGLAAPVAKVWATMALTFSGQGHFPPFAVEAMVIGGLAGIVFGTIDWFVTRRLKQDGEAAPFFFRLLPHSTGLGIGLIVPVSVSFTFFVGALLFCVILRKRASDETLNTTAAAGIFGEGLMGLVVAILVSLGVLHS